MRFALQGGHVHFATERGAAERDWHFAIEIIILALKNLVFLDVNDNVKIAMRTTAGPGFTVARRTQPRAICNSGRDFQHDAAHFFQPSLAVALAARLLDDLTSAATARTSLRDLKEPA